MTTTTTLRERYSEVCARVSQAARSAGRNASDILVIAVTKYAEPDQIRALLQLGHRDLGENMVQQLLQRAAMVEEFLSRHRSLPSTHRAGVGVQAPTLFQSASGALLPASEIAGKPVPAVDAVRWHMIGHLQRNKAKKAVEVCRLIHSVDSLRLAEELQSIGLRREQPVEILLQVNCSGEEQKFGCPPAAARHMAEQIDTMANVRLRGVMTMAAHGAAEAEIRGTFARCREIFEDITKMGISDGRFNILSMGMSGDFEIAIQEGANMVRVGSAIFGESARPDSHEDERPSEPDDDGDDAAF